MTDLNNSVSYRSLDGRVALVAGGASGIGRAIVTALAGQGSKVAFLDRDAKAAAVTITDCAENAPLFLPCDLTDISALRVALQQVRDQLGPVTILVNNAGNDDRLSTASVSVEPPQHARCIAAEPMVTLGDMGQGVGRHCVGQLHCRGNKAFEVAPPAGTGYGLIKRCIIAMGFEKGGT